VSSLIKQKRSYTLCLSLSHISAWTQTTRLLKHINTRADSTNWQFLAAEPHTELVATCANQRFPVWKTTFQHGGFQNFHKAENYLPSPSPRLPCNSLYPPNPPSKGNQTTRTLRMSPNMACNILAMLSTGEQIPVVQFEECVLDCSKFLHFLADV
jgi:hypothetical protein